MDTCTVVALEAGDREALAALADSPVPAVAAHPGLLDTVRRENPALLARVARLDVEWVRTGWRADLSLLPARLARRALLREGDILAACGLAARGLWLSGWDPSLLDILPDDVAYLLLAGLPRPGVVARHATVVPALPVVTALAGAPDGAALVLEATALDEIGAAMSPGELIAARHPVGLVSAPVTAVTTPAARRLARAASVAKAGTEALEDLLAAARPGADDPAAHLTRARGRIDAENHRGEGWSTVTAVDWDADGEADVEVETAHLSLVVDPADSLAVAVLDDMDRLLPLGADTGGGWLCRVAGTAPRFSVGQWQRSRGTVTVPFADDRVACLLSVSRSRISLTYRTAESLELGPELRLRLESPDVRVDGSEWSSLRGERVLTGHRLRLRFPDRYILVSCHLPSTFVLASDGGETVLRVERDVAASGRYEVSIDLAAPESTDRSTA